MVSLQNFNGLSYIFSKSWYMLLYKNLADVHAISNDSAILGTFKIKNNLQFVFQNDGTGYCN